MCAGKTTRDGFRLCGKARTPTSAALRHERTSVRGLGYASKNMSLLLYIRSLLTLCIPQVRHELEQGGIYIRVGGGGGRGGLKMGLGCDPSPNNSKGL